ncbi:exodeoxyribonuclease I [Rhabdochromatium marinum]|uniref:exodeoxyribonuclease I n=1 Tax=Rhabdochromatium marinum TaxID=48729 RepID=UPI001908BA7A|nr:exodeoxyribonuclease I [Rhabdochromatium marinum]MBK1648925.1 exodeoxyribonuclease I [Rhabdochromatium marinum]
MSPSFYWYDYETWGSDPRRDRPCQFAGLRTDTELNEISTEPPLVRYCQPADDFLPSPAACLITGITPQHAKQQGVREAVFAAEIQQQLARPATCSVGYNSLRFDEEVSRFLFYRNFLDPYAHSWRDQCSRWDLIDVLRMAHALRPQGLEWPQGDHGNTSFKLERLTAANDIPHQGAHDALADVRATLALARRLRAAQPRLFHYALGLRDKDRVREQLASGQPVLHVSSKYPAGRGCIAPVMVVAPPSPTDRHGMIVWDLREDPTELFELSEDVAAIRTRVFTRAEDLPSGVRRLPIKKLRLNAVPMVAPMPTLSDEAAERWAIDRTQVEQHWRQFLAHPNKVAAVEHAVRAAFDQPADGPAPDPDEALYRGFFAPADQPLIAQVRDLSPQQLAQAHLAFKDPRLPVLLFRYRARNWPETLTAHERQAWDHWRLTRLHDTAHDRVLTLPRYQQCIADLRAESDTDARKQQCLDALEAWPRQIQASMPPTDPASAELPLQASN